METTEEAPVTCLGKTFESEEERRKYFRDELRKKLPELKQIDGFPIGDDKDIVELSDPPYYTACPNPWLDEIIEQWENEKVEFENKGLRNNKFSIEEPFASDVREGRHNPIYMAHSYHTKVPHPAIMRFILHYTQPGDIVFDGLAGTGMTGVATLFADNPSQKHKAKIEDDFRKNDLEKPNWGKRRAICSDLSPVASFIAANFNSPSDQEKFIKEAKDVLKDLKIKYGWMYETKHNNKTGTIEYVVWSDVFICNNCGGEINYWDEALDKDNANLLDDFKCPECGKLTNKKEINLAFETEYDNALGKTTKVVKSKPVLINYSVGTSRYEKKPDEDDMKLLKKIKKNNSDKWYPTDLLPIGDKMSDPKNRAIKHVHQFYTLRNRILFSALKDRIKQNKNLNFLMTSSLIRTTKMYKYVPTLNGGGELKDRRTGNLSGTLYIGSLRDENNPFSLLESKIKSIAKAFKAENYNSISTQSANDLRNIKDSSVDYIFTDPPFGSNLMYSELNYIWESWLKVKTNNKKEAIENNSQKKNLGDYHNLMAKIFHEYYRVLKPDKWMTVEFSNTKASVWNGIQTALQKAGFIIANIAALDKKQGSFNAVTNPTSVKQDLIITCYKPNESFQERFDKNDGDIAIWDFIDEHLKHLPIHLKKKNSTTSIIERSSKILYDRLISFYVSRGLPVPVDSKDFQVELKKRYVERDGMYFSQEQASEYDEKKATTSEFVQLSLNVANENEGIEWLRAELQDNPQTYQDLQPKWMKAITAVRKGDVLPELQTILEQNYIKIEDGSWRVPNMNEAKDREAIRSKTLLREFEEYVNQVTGQGANKLKEARAEALRAGFKNCWDGKDFKTIVRVGEKIPESLLLEDDQLLMYYDIATDRV